MHARVTRSRAPVERVDEGIEWFRETALPQATSIPGFRGALELVDRESGEALTVTLWESADARDASETAAAGMRSDAESTGSEVLGVERYEVAVSTF